MKVYGTYGSLYLDDAGNVTRREHDDDETAYADITRFNLEEWREWARKAYEPAYLKSKQFELDILEVGYWTDAGTYIAPDEGFRYRVETRHAEEE